MSKDSHAPLLTIIIPTHFRPGSLDLVLTALGKQTVGRDVFEVIVVLDGHCAATEQVLRKHCTGLPLRWLVQPPTGAPAARNRGVAAARGDVLLFLDDDIIAVPELVESHLKWHLSAPDVMVFGTFARAANSPEGLVQETVDWSDLHRERCNRPGYRPDPKDVANGNVSMRRAHLVRLGGRDEGFVGIGGSDDAELARRWVREGLRLQFETKALGYHYWTKGWAGYIRDRRQIGRGDYYFARKHPDAVADLHITRFVEGPRYRRWLTGMVAAAPEWCFTAVEAVIARFASRLNPAFGRSALKGLIRFTGGAYYVRGYFEERNPLLSAPQRPAASPTATEGTAV